MAVHYGGKGPGHMSRSMGGFNPRSLFAGGVLGVWYDPSDLATVWQDSARTTPGVVDQPVGCIDDKSGNGVNATSSLTARPTLRLASGRYYLEFDGVDDILGTSAINFSAVDAVTMCYGIYKASDVAVQAAIEFGSGNGSARMQIPAAGTGYQHVATGTVGSTASATGFAAPNLSVITTQADISSDINIMRINGTQVASVATDLGTGNMGTNQFTFGARSGSLFPMTGRFYGVILLGALLSGNGQMENWMNGKTGAY
jgi:hypothetical protein